MDRSAGMGLMMSDVRLIGWDGLLEQRSTTERSRGARA